MAKKWGSWENLEQIGEGGGGRVYKVQHVDTKQIGALKVLKNKDRIGRFRSEVEAIRSLNHPGIVRVLDTNLDQGDCFAVYEFEPGGSLGDLSTEELLALPLECRLQLCEQVCEALHAAHQASMVHRDVKPDNILISEDRKIARLCDFGLVFIEDGERQTATMEQVGSRYYIPPELEDGRADDVSVVSDIYSMGKVLYKLVSGTDYARERHREPKYDLATRLKDPHLELISRILDRSAVADIGARLTSAAEMAQMIRSAREQLETRRPVEGVGATYRCVFCGIGVYKPICTSSDQGNAHNNGYKEGNIGRETMVYLECANCGNCQRFKLKHGGDRWFPEIMAELRRTSRW